MVNVLLGLTVGAIAFAVNVLVHSREQFSAAAKGWMISSFALLFLAATVGLYRRL